MFTTDAFLVSNFYNIFYLTQFEGLSPSEREAYVLLVKGRKIIITDSRYNEGKHSGDSELYVLKPEERAGEVVGRLCKENKIQTLGVETDDLKWIEVQQMQKLGIELVPLAHVFSPKRSIKLEEEIFAIKQACHIGDSVLRDITPYIHPGQTEKEIAWLLEKMVREGYGAEIAFDPIVAVDANAAIPHYNTKKGNGIVQESSLILIDFGVKFHNYCSDITRMVVVGDVSSEITSPYEKLLVVQENTIKKLNTTTSLKEADAFCRSELEKSGLPNYSHSTGHGVGLEVHEAPRLSAVSEDVKVEGQVFTVEPGVYYPGKWGMRIEDTVMVSMEGEIEVLTRFPKELK